MCSALCIDECIICFENRIKTLNSYTDIKVVCEISLLDVCSTTAMMYCFIHTNTYEATESLELCEQKLKKEEGSQSREKINRLKTADHPYQRQHF